MIVRAVYLPTGQLHSIDHTWLGTVPGYFLVGAMEAFEVIDYAEMVFA